MPAQLRLWRDGALKLEELVTRRYRVDEVAQGFDDMHAGRNMRGVIVFDGLGDDGQRPQDAATPV